jgi:hypothetical protein
VQDAADHAAIVHPMGTTPTARKQRLKPLPFGIAEPIELLSHQGLRQIGNLESQVALRRNPY